MHQAKGYDFDLISVIDLDLDGQVLKHRVIFLYPNLERSS
jgi:hypothetical protein